MDQFYVTLPSNTISDQKNTASQFVVHLPQKLHLSGDWECGLCEIVYPHNWSTLSKTDGVFAVQMKKSSEKIKVSLPQGCYDTPQEFINMIHGILKEGASKVPGIDKAISFAFDHVTRRIKFTLRSDVDSLYLSEALSNMLGFNFRAMKNSQIAEKEPDMRAGFESMYVYCNILEPQIVGNISAPLLRIVNTEGKYPEIIVKTFDEPRYIPVLVKDISMIEVNIKNDVNEYVNFIYGKVIVKLHFRRVKKWFF
jgi:hypothetical protein